MRAGSFASSTSVRPSRRQHLPRSPICALIQGYPWPAKSPPIRSTASNASGASHPDLRRRPAANQIATGRRRDAYGGNALPDVVAAGPRFPIGYNCARAVPENPGRYRGAPAVAARPMLEDQRQTGPIWLPAGDLRPEAGSRVQILAHTAIVGQSARLQPSSQRFTVAERPVWWLACLRDGQGGRSSGGIPAE